MFWDIIRASFETIGKLFNLEVYKSISNDTGYALFLIMLLAVAPIIIYGLFNLCFWFFGERKLEKSVVQSSVRRGIKQIVGILLMMISAYAAICAMGLFFVIISDRLILPILSPIIYCIIVLGFIAFVKYTIGNIVKLIAGAIKRKK